MPASGSHSSRRRAAVLRCRDAEDAGHAVGHELARGIHRRPTPCTCADMVLEHARHWRWPHEHRPATQQPAPTAIRREVTAAYLQHDRSAGSYDGTHDIIVGTNSPRELSFAAAVPLAKHCQARPGEQPGRLPVGISVMVLVPVQHCPCPKRSEPTPPGRWRRRCSVPSTRLSQPTQNESSPHLADTEFASN